VVYWQATTMTPARAPPSANRAVQNIANSRFSTNPIDGIEDESVPRIIEGPLALWDATNRPRCQTKYFAQGVVDLLPVIRPSIADLTVDVISDDPDGNRQDQPGSAARHTVTSGDVHQQGEYEDLHARRNQRCEQARALPALIENSIPGVAQGHLFGKCDGQAPRTDQTENEECR
jgi:hypothetical protein